MRREIINTNGLELSDQVVTIKRVSKTVKGGRIYKYSALVVVGNGAGILGYGIGKASEALQYLEMVRARARNSGSDKSVLPQITETNQAKLRELIWHERRVELAMEYNRYYDLARTGRLYETMKAYYEKYEKDPSSPGYSGQDKGKFVQPYHVHMPISNQALQASVYDGKQTLEQNEGY